MKLITQKEIKKELINIIKTLQIKEVIYEPRYEEGYDYLKILVGSIITIRTTEK